MACSGCAARRKLLAEAAESLRNGDAATARQAIAATAISMREDGAKVAGAAKSVALARLGVRS